MNKDMIISRLKSKNYIAYKSIDVLYILCKTKSIVLSKKINFAKKIVINCRKTLYIK